jgi:hypothetical protein
MEKEKLKKLIMEAYEAGWRGSLELKEAYAEEVVEKKESTEVKNYWPFNYSESDGSGGPAFTWQVTSTSSSGQQLSVGEQLSLFDTTSASTINVSNR